MRHQEPMCRSSSISPTAAVIAQIVDDYDHGVSIEGFSIAQQESKAALCTIDKLRKDFHIPDSIELKIPEPNNNMVDPLDGLVALYPSTFKARSRLPLHLFIGSFLRSLNIVLDQLNPVVYKAHLGHYVLWKHSGI